MASVSQIARGVKGRHRLVWGEKKDYDMRQAEIQAYSYANPMYHGPTICLALFEAHDHSSD